MGEMERDSLLAHGAAYIVQERLLHCSDEATSLVCAKCRSLVSPMTLPVRGSSANKNPGQAYCRTCESGDDVHLITIPYVFKYLTNELAAMNIKTCLSISDRR